MLAVTAPGRDGPALGGAGSRAGRARMDAQTRRWNRPNAVIDQACSRRSPRDPARDTARDGRGCRLEGTPRARAARRHRSSRPRSGVARTFQPSAPGSECRPTSCYARTCERRPDAAAKSIPPARLGRHLGVPADPSSLRRAAHRGARPTAIGARRPLNDLDAGDRHLPASGATAGGPVTRTIGAEWHLTATRKPSSVDSLEGATNI